MGDMSAWVLCQCEQSGRCANVGDVGSVTKVSSVGDTGGNTRMVC